jgi:hypothetical protein
MRKDLLCTNSSTFASYEDMYRVVDSTSKFGDDSYVLETTLVPFCQHDPLSHLGDLRRDWVRFALEALSFPAPLWFAFGHLSAWL